MQVTDGFTLTSTLMDEVICRFGVPTQLHSDQGSNLNAEVNHKLCQLLGIQRTRTTAYHPQGNGQVERFNCTVKAGSGSTPCADTTCPKYCTLA